MDILKKMFQPKSEKGEQQDVSPSNKDEFRKPQWFEEPETDDELFDDDRKFAFQVFTNPLELQRHFERQMQRMLESFNDLEDGDVAVEKNVKEDFLKPGFESKLLKEFEKQRGGFIDTDLDGEILGDQLHSLLERFNQHDKLLPTTPPNKEEPSSILPANKISTRLLYPKPKLSDEETIMGHIHGTLNADENSSTSRRMPARNTMPDITTPMPFSGVFDGGYQGPKLFSQSVMTKTIRKPDGSYETTKITQDSSGKKTTTITRMIDGKKETIVTHDGPGGGGGGGASNGYDIGIGNGSVKSAITAAATAAADSKQLASDRNVTVTKEGYAVPRNLW